MKPDDKKKTILVIINEYAYQVKVYLICLPVTCTVLLLHKTSNNTEGEKRKLLTVPHLTKLHPRLATIKAIFLNHDLSSRKISLHRLPQS